MSLSPGHKLAHYEILEPIGKGGMGEVYRARDTKLGRNVAIKVLPAEFAQDTERMNRFEREARLLAQLNHANIATLHGLEEHDGQQFLIMELIEGETLAERIDRRPLTWNEAAPLFGQIADAIKAAHAKGIVHRDLKPANIKLAADGRPKILDYGLARAGSGRGTPDAAFSHSPTLTKDTELGAIMGTPSYMSPEQARGEVVDGRTDVWAFACCLYEALTAEKAFPGTTTADVFAAIMNKDPRWDALPAQGDGRLRKLLERCLQKDVHQRLRGLEYARLELEALTTNADAPPPSSRDRRTHLLPWIVALGAAVFALVGFLRPTRDASPRSPIRFSIQLPRGDRLLTAFAENIAISPDGSQLAYVGIRGAEQYRLFLRSMDRLQPEPVSDTETATMPFFSPDSRFVGFGHGPNALKRIVLGGVTSVELADRNDGGAFWAPDRHIYFSLARGSGIVRVPEQGGDVEIVAALRADLGDVDLWSPHLLPDGDSLLLVARDGSGVDKIVVETLSTGMRRVLVDNGTFPRYARTGHLVFARASTIMAAPFDVDELVVERDPIVVVDGLQSGMFAISDQGTLVYVPDDVNTAPTSQLVKVDRQGISTPLVETPRRFWDPRWSPDGDKIVVSVSKERQTDLWSVDLARETLTRLTFGAGAIRPVWSPDGSRLIFGSQGSQLFWLDPNGSDEVRSVLSSELVTIAASASSDGRFLVHRQLRPGTGWDIVFQRDGDDSDVEVYLSTPFKELHPLLSPDDRYIAYTSNESGRIEVYVDTFPRRSKKVQISNAGGTEPVWSRDGKELYYRTQQKMMRVSVSTEPEFTPSNPSLLFEGNFLMGFVGQTANYDIAPDGESFVMLQSIEGMRGYEIAVVLNWFEELKRLVPTAN